MVTGVCDGKPSVVAFGTNFTENAQAGGCPAPAAIFLAGELRDKEPYGADVPGLIDQRSELHILAGTPDMICSCVVPFGSPFRRTPENVGKALKTAVSACHFDHVAIWAT